MHSVLDVEAFGQFKNAAAEGAVLEVKMRILCEKAPRIAHKAVRDKLEFVEDAIAEEFSQYLTKDECLLLKQCRQLRNKILHADFHKARRKLHDLGVQPRSGDVTKVDIAGKSPVEVLDTLRRVAEGSTEDAILVSDTESTQEATIFGWFLELWKSGDLNESARVFVKANQIIDRLLDVEIA